MSITLQSVFDRVATHLLAQNARSRDESNGNCLYRGPDGTKCAIGCIIKDEFYDPRLENKSAYSPAIVKALYRSFKADDPDFDLFPGTDEELEPYIYSSLGNGCRVVNSTAFELLALLSDLQQLHDDSLPWQWEEGLKDVASDHGLALNVL